MRATKKRINKDSFLLDRALDFISGTPEINLPRLLEWVDALHIKSFEPRSRVLHEILDDPECLWYRYIMNLWKEIDIDVLKSFFQNFIWKSSIFGFAEQKKLSEKYGCNIPFTMLVDPTSACNLNCIGCWTAEYGNQLHMSYETLNDIIRQGKELKIHFYLYSGGEPLVRKEDILRLCEVHSDCQFAAFTNGTLIDDSFAEALLRVKNFIPILSVEGFEEETDFRRGAGTYGKVREAARILKEHRLPFGLSCCCTSKNVMTIGSEAYFDRMIEWGARFCWFFTYMPVGKEAAPELMVTAEQRAFMFEQIHRFRKTKPLVTLDFWNDGQYAGGCVAGGRRYLHINANGDIEPCAFIHYSDSNIREKTVLEALQSPLFMAYHERQPFHENLLRVCPLLDHPGVPTGMVESSGAHSTEMRDPEPVRELSEKCVQAAENWATVAGENWSCNGNCPECVRRCKQD